MISGEDSHDKIGIEIPADKENFDALWWKAGVFVAWNLLMRELTDIVPFDKNITGSMYIPVSRTGFFIGAPYIQFIFPMSISSSVVTETASLLLLLAAQIEFKSLINQLPTFKANAFRPAPLVARIFRRRTRRAPRYF